jgi:hypothetical protein
MYIYNLCFQLMLVLIFLYFKSLVEVMKSDEAFALCPRIHIYQTINHRT